MHLICMPSLHTDIISYNGKKERIDSKCLELGEQLM